MTIEERYLKSADRGDFQYEVLDADDSTGKILSESCKYKGKYVGNIRNNGDNFEIEINELPISKEYFLDYRMSRRSARNLIERIIRNDYK